MEIVVEGYLIETKNIFDIVDLSSSRIAGFKIRSINHPDIIITKDIPYESYSSDISNAHRKYDNLRKAIAVEWEKDKTELPVFKL